MFGPQEVEQVDRVLMLLPHQYRERGGVALSGRELRALATVEDEVVDEHGKEDDYQRGDDVAPDAEGDAHLLALALGYEVHVVGVIRAARGVLVLERQVVLVQGDVLAADAAEVLHGGLDRNQALQVIARQREFDAAKATAAKRAKKK